MSSKSIRKCHSPLCDAIGDASLAAYWVFYPTWLKPEHRPEFCERTIAAFRRSEDALGPIGILEYLQRRRCVARIASVFARRYKGTMWGGKFASTWVDRSVVITKARRSRGYAKIGKTQPMLTTDRDRLIEMERLRRESGRPSLENYGVNLAPEGIDPCGGREREVSRTGSRR